MAQSWTELGAAQSSELEETRALRVTGTRGVTTRESRNAARASLRCCSH